MNPQHVARIAEFCRTGSGSTPSRSELVRYYQDGTIPWVKSGELRESLILDTEERITASALKETSVKLVPAGAILLAMYGATVGRLAILGVEATTNQAVCHIVPNPDLADTRYVYRALAAQVPNIVSMGVGGAQPNISQALVKALEIPLPPLPLQRRIVTILDQADALRVKRRDALEQLDSLTQAVFIEMFGDPVSNPKAWPNLGLGGVVELMQYGPRFYDEAYSVEGVRIARITDLSETGDLDFDSMPRMTVTSKDLMQFALRPGDLIFARTGATVGKVALYRDGDPPCIPGAYFIRMKFTSQVTPDYAATVLKSKSVREIVTLQSRQAAQQNFSGPGLRRLPFPVPPQALQEALAIRTKAINALKATHRVALAESNALFASLQHRAFSGQLS